MARPNFLRDLNDSATELKEFFVPSTRKWLEKIVTTAGDDVEKPLVSPDHIFELVLYFCLIREAMRSTKNYRFIQPSSSKYGYRFPQSPGLKRNFCFFRFEFEGNTYDLCLGTEFKNDEFENESNAPDVSLQFVSDPESHDDGRPVTIWECKFLADAGGLPKSHLSDMYSFCQILKCSLPEERSISQKVFGPKLGLNALVTNIGARKFPEARSLRGGFSVVFEFKGTEGSANPIPTIQKHEEYRSN